MKIRLIGNVYYGKTQKEKGEPCIALSYTGSNTPMAKLTVSEPRNWGRSADDKANGKNKLDFWDVTILGKTAEFVSKNFVEGSPIIMEGEAYHSKGADGKSYVNIAITEVEFAPKDFSQQGQSVGTAAPQGQPAPAPQQYQQQGYVQQAPPQQGYVQQVPQQGYVQPNPPQGGQVVQFQAQQAPQPQQQVQQTPPQQAPQPQQQVQQTPPANPPQGGQQGGDPGFGSFPGFEPMGAPGSNGF